MALAARLKACPEYESDFYHGLLAPLWARNGKQLFYYQMDGGQLKGKSSVVVLLL